MAVSDQDLEDALGIAAKMIDLYGYMYWPIFERLEAELDARSDRAKRVEVRLRQHRKLSTGARQSVRTGQMRSKPHSLRGLPSEAHRHRRGAAPSDR